MRRIVFVALALALLFVRQFSAQPAVTSARVVFVRDVQPIFREHRYDCRSRLGPCDGSWFVQTRAVPLQPFMDSGFPHGPHQFISAAATNWATQALLYAAPQPARGPSR